MQRLIHFALQRKLLLLSLIANFVLAVFFLLLLIALRGTYSDYRHFRALPIGVSKASTATAADNTVVLYGDSRMETWHPAPESSPYRFVNAGISGETTSEMRRRFEHDVLRLKPDYVVIQAGVNDLTAAVTKGIESPEALVNTMRDNLTYFITALESNNIETIVTSILPVKPLNFKRRIFWNDTLSAQIDNTNRWLQQTTLDLNADWFDLDPYLLDESGNIIDKLYYDTLHINYDGYRVLNLHLDQYLKNL